jgi:hypothetical protein
VNLQGLSGINCLGSTFFKKNFHAVAKKYGRWRCHAVQVHVQGLSQINFHGSTFF